MIKLKNKKEIERLEGKFMQKERMGLLLLQVSMMTKKKRRLRSQRLSLSEQKNEKKPQNQKHQNQKDSQPKKEDKLPKTHKNHL